MEKSANRAAADARRRERRLEAMQSRVIEREMVRFEREQERARVRAEREAERRRIEAERQQALQSKQDAKDAQLRAWQLEYEEHQEREQIIDRIANDAPEVEERDRLYAEIAERRQFEPEPFVAPSPPNTEAKARKLHQQADKEVAAALDPFRPDTRAVRQGQIVAGVVGIGGAGVHFTQAVPDSSIPLSAFLIGLGGVVVAQFIAKGQATRQRAAVETKARQDAQGRLQEALGLLERESKAEAQAALQKARAAHDAASTAARAEFDREEDERLLALRELGEGNTGRMREALEDAFPLDLPVPCKESFAVQSSSVVYIEIDVPEPSVLPMNEAKLLASGKVSYKEKNEKRLREQYLRLVTGLAFRHASEAMLNVPTCQCVELRAFRTALDPSIGKPMRRSVLEVRFDYPKLAPMTMEGLDPMAALKYFEHRINIAKNRDILALDPS
jgi:hypothetical protein